MDDLFIACQLGRLEEVELLLAAGVDPAARDSRALELAAMYGHVAVVDRLLQSGRVDPAARDNCALKCAAKYGYVAVVDRLLREGEHVNPSAQRNYALRWAAEKGHLEVVNRLLLDPRVDPGAKFNYALRWAVRYSHLGVVERLLRDNRVEVPPQALHLAAAYGCVEVLKVLLNDYRVVVVEAGADKLEEEAKKGGQHVEETVRQWRAEVGL